MRVCVNTKGHQAILVFVRDEKRVALTVPGPGRIGVVDLTGFKKKTNSGRDRDGGLRPRHARSSGRRSSCHRQL